MTREIQRNEDGTLPAFAWPGGYPVYYVVRDGGTLCPACANGGNGSIAYVGESPDGIEDSQWAIIGQEINYEDESLACDHCNAAIDAAYGN